MKISLPDSLTEYVRDRVRLGGYASADEFVADLVSGDAAALERVAAGEALAVDARFDQRLNALRDQAAASDYVDAGPESFDEMEREALALIASGQRV